MKFKILLKLRIAWLVAHPMSLIAPVCYSAHAYSTQDGVWERDQHDAPCLLITDT